MRHRQYHGLMALEREMSTQPVPSRSVAQFILFTLSKSLKVAESYTVRPGA